MLEEGMLNDIIGGRPEGFLDIAYSPAEAYGVANAAYWWPILLTSAITLPGLFYSYWMAPNPVGRDQDRLQQAFSWLASPVLFFYDMVPGLTNIPYVSTMMRYLMPQVVLHKYVKKYFDDAYRAKGVGILRPFLEEKYKIDRDASAPRFEFPRDFVPSEMQNPSQFTKTLAAFASLPISAVKALIYDIPRERGWLERHFDIKPKTLEERIETDAYLRAKEYAGPVGSVYKSIKGAGNMAYQIAEQLVDAPLNAWSWMASWFDSARKSTESEGGISSFVNNRFDNLNENLNDRAQTLEDAGLYFSKDTWLTAQWVVVSAVTAASLYGTGKALGWVSNKVTSVTGPLLARLPVVSRIVQPASSTINSQLLGLQAQVNGISSLNPGEVQDLLRELAKQSKAMQSYSADQRALLTSLQSQLIGQMHANPAVFNVYGAQAFAAGGPQQNNVPGTGAPPAAPATAHPAPAPAGLPAPGAGAGAAGVGGPP